MEILSEDSAEEIATLSIPTNFAKLLVLEGFLKYLENQPFVYKKNSNKIGFTFSLKTLSIL